MDKKNWPEIISRGADAFLAVGTVLTGYFDPLSTCIGVAAGILLGNKKLVRLDNAPTPVGLLANPYVKTAGVGLSYFALPFFPSISTFSFGALFTTRVQVQNPHGTPQHA